MPRLLCITSHSFYPDAAGGADRNYQYLLDALRRRGWDVEVICSLGPYSPLRGELRARRQRARREGKPEPRFLLDESLGYPCWRGLRSPKHPHCWARWLVSTALVRLRGAPRSTAFRFRGCAPRWSNVFCSAELGITRGFFQQRLAATRPDVVLGHTGAMELLQSAGEQGYQSFYYAQGATHVSRGRHYPDRVHVIANGPYVARRASQASPNEVGVVLSFMERAQYAVERRERRYLTFINPITEKGLPVAEGMARRLPEERFLFLQGGWFDYEGSVMGRLRRRTSLPNVEHWSFRDDMRTVYGVTDILLVPSKRDESFGRVIVEAQMSGIPVVAANDGGIDYAMGEGGVLVTPRDDVSAYVDAIRRLRADPAWYDRLSKLALENTYRPEFDPDRQVDAFIEFVTSRRPW